MSATVIAKYQERFSEVNLSLGYISDSKVIFFFDVKLAERLNRTDVRHARPLLRKSNWELIHKPVPKQWTNVVG